MGCWNGLANSARRPGNLLWERGIDASNSVAQDQQPFLREKLGLAARSAGILGWQGAIKPREGGKSVHRGKIDVLGERDYSWHHP